MITKLVLMMMAQMMANGSNLTKNIENRDETRVWLNGSDVHSVYGSEYEIGLFDTVHIDRGRCGSVEVDAEVLMIIYGQIHDIPDITKESVMKDMGYIHYYDQRDDVGFFQYFDDNNVLQTVDITEYELNELAKHYYIVK